MRRTSSSPFYETLAREIGALGGYHNAHMHLDRANTLADGFVDHGRMRVLESSHISLQKKHALIATVHSGPAYDEASLRERIGETIDVMCAAGTRLADTMVDVTPDRVGTNALEIVNDIARAAKNRITIRTAAYTPLGFSDREPERWDVFERGVAVSDFIGSLPEADDTPDYPDNIGFEEHCVRMLDLARRTKKMLHVHTDQLNIPSENGTERLIDVIRREGPIAGDEPMIWVVHAISPATYENARWHRFVEGLLECNIGMICCPSAAIGMRQLRSIRTPTYNSIPRVLELAAAGVPVRLGSDNVADMCSPSTTADLGDEVFVLSAAVRYYNVGILARLAAGLRLDDAQRDLIAEHLRLNDVEIEKLVRRWT